jgi:putative membrane protein
MSNTRTKGAIALAAIVMLAACDAGSDSADSLAVNDTMGVESQMAAGTTADGWSDAQILGLLSRLNGGRMAAAELAKERATNPEVRELAETLDREHVEMQRQLNDLASRMNLTPSAPEDSAGIVEANEELAELQSRNAGREWDEEFVDELEDWQEDTRDALTRAIEATRSDELRQALMEMRGTVEQHLQRTTQLKERLG